MFGSSNNHLCIGEFVSVVEEGREKMSTDIVGSDGITFFSEGGALDPSSAHGKKATFHPTQDE